MLALCVVPVHPDSAALRDVAQPAPDAAESVLVRTLEIGICGTDHQIPAGKYGGAPQGVNVVLDFDSHAD